MDILEDNNFFRRLGLIKTFELKSNCTVDRFKEIFQGKVGTDNSLKDVYFSKNKFKGTIRRYSFDIYKSLNVHDASLSTFAAKGTYNEIENGLLINTAVYLPIGTFIQYFSITLLVNIILIVNLLISYPLQLWTVVLICGAVLTGTTLFFIISFRNGVLELKKELEKEFINWTA